MIRCKQCGSNVGIDLKEKYSTAESEAVGLCLDCFEDVTVFDEPKNCTMNGAVTISRDGSAFVNLHFIIKDSDGNDKIVDRAVFCRRETIHEQVSKILKTEMGVL